MSYIYTNENAKRDSNQSNLFNIVDPLVIWRDDIVYYPYFVSKEEEMNPSMICFNIYNKFDYIDELLTWNNILNPWSIREGQLIYYIEEDSIESLKVDTNQEKDTIVQSLVNPSKDTKKDPNRDSGTGLPPTIKPTGLKDVNVDYNNKTIKIIDRFK